MRFARSESPEAIKAARTLSRLSATVLSGRPTMFIVVTECPAGIRCLRPIFPFCSER